MPSIKLKYRDVKSMGDPSIPFVVNSWIRSYEWAIKREFGDESKDFYQVLVPLSKRMIRRHRLVVAEIDHDCYVGWICGKKGELDYVYVKTLYRRDGIASELISRVCGTMGVYRFGSKNYGFIKSLEENFIFKPFERETNEQESKQNTNGDGQVPARECIPAKEGDDGRAENES